LDHGIDDTLVSVDGMGAAAKQKASILRLNKQVGGELGTSEITVKAYRAAR
jgi:hypothetical protein